MRGLAFQWAGRALANRVPPSARKRPEQVSRFTSEKNLDGQPVLPVDSCRDYAESTLNNGQSPPGFNDLFIGTRSQVSAR